METVSKSDSLEFYAQPAALLLVEKGQSFQAPVFEPSDAIVDIAQGDTPLVIRRPVGLGELTLISLDVTQPLFANWNGRSRLIGRATALSDQSSGAVGQGDDFSTRHGFSDISGQTRAGLERFSRVVLVTFTTVAVLIGLYVLCIGPGDYFFLKHIVGKMELTWLTFTVVTIAFCGIGWWLVQRTKPKELQINQVDVVDVDAVGHRVRGESWIDIYSPRTAEYKLQMPKTSRLGLDLQETLTSSFGLPGEGIGGMQATSPTRLFTKPYLIDHSQSAEVDQISKMPIAIAATKPLVAKWTGKHEWNDFGKLRYFARAGRLSGTVHNPLPVGLHNCYLLHDNRAYLFDDLQAGASIDVDSGVERSIKVFLQAKQGEVETARWILADRNLSRIIEMQMFFQAAGGSNFTGLTNDYQNELDLSYLLPLGRAMLVGRVEDGLLAPIECDAETGSSQFDQSLVYVRFVLPVQPTEKAR